MPSVTGSGGSVTKFESTDSGSFDSVSIGTTATEIRPAKGSRVSVMVQNIDTTVAIHIGLSNAVTSSNGFKLAAGATLTFEDYVGAIWGIAASGTVDVRFLELVGGRP